MEFHPPHAFEDGACYFLTWRKHQHQADFGGPERSCIADAIVFFHEERYLIHAYVVMNDHVHVVVSPMTHSLPQIIHSWKSYSTNILQRRFDRAGSIWQSDYFDRIIRDNFELNAIVEYIIANPRRRWPTVEEYPWARCFVQERDLRRAPGAEARPPEGSVARSRPNRRNATYGPGCEAETKGTEETETEETETEETETETEQTISESPATTAALRSFAAGAGPRHTTDTHGTSR